MLLTLLPVSALAEQPGVGGSSVVRIQDTETWFGDATESFDTLDSYWNDQVTSQPATYTVNEGDKTVSLGDAAALVWWAKQVNSNTSFAGYTVNLTADIDLSAHYWTPICTGTVSYTEDGKYSIVNSAVLDNTILNGNGYTITGLTTQTGVRGPNQDSKPGDGQNCYYDAAFIGYSCCNVTIENLTFAGARVAISKPFEEVTRTYGSSMVAVVVGAQSGGSLTLQNVAVKGANVLAMQKASAFVGNLMGGSTLTVNQCEISDSTFSGYFMVAPIAAYCTINQVDVNGIKLSNNTVNVVEQSSYRYAVDPDTGAEYWDGYLNASTTVVFDDGETATGKGSELDLAAELNGYAYPTLADAVQAVVDSESKTGTVTLLKDYAGSGIGLFNGQGAENVNLTIDFGGHTYTCQDPAVGSSGTESQGFHLEKDNTVTLKNGTIAVADESTKTKMLIQNYCNLTLQDLNLKGAAVTQYLISSNYGDTVLNNVNMDGTHGQLVAIDLMHWLGTIYADKAPTITINNTADNTIRGNIDVYCYDQATSGYATDCESKPTLTIHGGMYSVDPTAYLAKGEFLTATQVDGLYRVEKQDIDVTIPSTDPSSEDVQITVPEDTKNALSNEAIQVVTDIATGNSSTAVSAETVKNVNIALKNNAPIGIKVQFTEDNIPSSDKTAAQGVVSGNETLSQFFDLSLVLMSNDSKLGPITHLSAPMSFTISVPEDLIQADRTFFIVRVHEGAAEKLPATFDANAHTLTFSSDKFSTYALGYTDPSGSGSDSSSSSESTGSNTNSSSNTGSTAGSTASSTSAKATPTPAPQSTTPPTAATTSAGIPQTADASHPMLWFVLLCLSGMGVLFTTIYNVKKKFDH